MDGVHEASDPVNAVQNAEAIFIGEKEGRRQKLRYHVTVKAETVDLSKDGCLFLFVGGGNTFRLLKGLYDNKLVLEIRKRVLEVCHSHTHTNVQTFFDIMLITNANLTTKTKC